MIAISRPIAIAVLIGAVSACAGPKESGERTDQTSDPRQVAPTADVVNVAAAQTSGPALVVTVEVDGSSVALVRARVLRTPAAPPRRETAADLVLFRAFRGNEVVGTAIVSDPVINVQEGVGLVELEQRSVTASVPMERPADILEVASTQGRFAAARFPVANVVLAHCREFPASPLCGEVNR